MSKEKSHHPDSDQPKCRIEVYGGKDVSLPFPENVAPENLLEAAMKTLDDSVAFREKENAWLEGAICPHLWPEKAKGKKSSSVGAKTRPTPNAILDPIKESLRRMGHAIVVAPPLSSPLTNREMMVLFGNDLKTLESSLGRVLLDAIVRGTRDFSESLHKALKDADQLFHRGRSAGSNAVARFGGWWAAIPEQKKRQMTRNKIRETFQDDSGQDLSGIEWTEIRRCFQLDAQPRKPKSRSRMY